MIVKANKDGGTTVGFSKEYEPYMGWCDVEGCENEGCGGGFAWRESGYWTVCSEHSQQHREGKPQPQMKQTAIDRENSRDSNGYLPSPPPIDFKIEENLEIINKQQWEDIWLEFENYIISNSLFGFRFSIHAFRDWLIEKYVAPEKK